MPCAVDMQVQGDALRVLLPRLPARMHAPKRLDIGWTDCASGLLGCLRPGDGRRAEDRIGALWSKSDETIVCLSVRTAFDLFLSAADWPQGSEVLVSAITIPDMVRIIEAHGLVAVPVDLDPATLAPRLDTLAWAARRRAVAVLVAHLFGSVIDLQPIIALARRHGLAVLEDCAQAYAGPAYRGHPDADATFFSFGTIKTATALGGGIARVREPRRLERMRAQHATYPVQSRRTFAARVAKCMALKALTLPTVYGALVRLCAMAGVDHQCYLQAAVRGFPGEHLLDAIRRRPSPALLRLLARRIRRFDPRRLAEREAAGRALAREVPASLLVPGARCARHAYWALLVVTPEPDALVQVLRQRGFDATRQSNLYVVPPPADRDARAPQAATRLPTPGVFLPGGAVRAPERRAAVGAALRDHLEWSRGPVVAWPSSRTPTRAR